MTLATDIDMSEDFVSYRYRCLKMTLATDIDMSEDFISYRYRYV